MPMMMVPPTIVVTAIAVMMPPTVVVAAIAVMTPSVPVSMSVPVSALDLDDCAINATQRRRHCCGHS